MITKTNVIEETIAGAVITIVLETNLPETKTRPNSKRIVHFVDRVREAIFVSWLTENSSNRKQSLAMQQRTAVGVASPNKSSLEIQTPPPRIIVKIELIRSDRKVLSNQKL
jgi:hypothetical protein